LVTNSCGRFVVDLGLGPYDCPPAAAIGRADGSGDGRLVTSGQFGVGRFTANGSLDGSFGQNGVAAALGTGEDIGIRSSGRVVVVARNGPDFRAILYEPNGRPAQGCDGQAVTTSDISGGQDDSFAVLVQPNDYIVVGDTRACIPVSLDCGARRSAADALVRPDAAAPQ
jgi:hypothetical protein